MAQSVPAPESSTQPRHLGSPEPVAFPSEELLPESQLHLELTTLLYLLLKAHFGSTATIGSDQFVYFDASDPKQCLAPDTLIKLEPPGDDITSWKTWERGAPDVAVEIVNDSDAPELPWQEKLVRNTRLGVSEVVRFDPKGTAGRRLQIWDRTSEQLVERRVHGDRVSSKLIDLTWVVAPAQGRSVALRIATDAEGIDLVPTADEARQAEVEARQHAEQVARQALARVRELEEELHRRGG